MRRSTVLYTLFLVVAAFAAGAATATVCLDRSVKAIAIEGGGTATFRPIKALDDGWYLVEVEQSYTCENPLPIGNKHMTVVVPHLVRMRASELDNPHP